ncbi:MAG: hypothetical protein E6H86_13150 [Chloroflexi bacterium]|nr:MAG: hypothetical protein E6H86_13150 [Chloroflexota bacterium]
MRYRGLFWPALLIFAGVVALLVNTGLLSVDRLYELVNLWPLILIVIGLELIVRRTAHGTTANVATALIVLLAIAGAAAYVTIVPNPAATNSHDFSGRIGELTKASVAIDAGAANITITGSDLGPDLYRAHIEYSGPTPEVTLTADGDLNIDQPNNNVFGIEAQKFVLNLQLSSGVTWKIAEKSGATTDSLQLGSIHVASISLNGGASHDDLVLGPPSGVVPVTINGGALTVGVHRPTGTKASVDVSGGAVTLNADGREMHAIGKLSFSTGDLGSDYYQVQVNGGACTVTVDTAIPSG